MNRNISMTNVSFNYLSQSADFLNLIIHNISSCVLLLNKDMMLQAYNEPLKSMFADKSEEKIIYQKCGDVLGCAYAVEEAKECGTTSHCKFCSLRLSALETYNDGIVVTNQLVEREFYTTNMTKKLKFLQFSTRIFNFNLERYILLIINDVSPLVNKSE